MTNALQNALFFLNYIENCNIIKHMEMNQPKFQKGRIHSTLRGMDTRAKEATVKFALQSLLKRFALKGKNLLPW